MINSLAQKLSGIKQSIGDALFGVQPMMPTSQDSGQQYPQELQDYLDYDFENQQYVKDLLNKPAQERMSLPQLKEGFVQGLNYGSQGMANEQKRLNINIPKTGEEIDLARTGQFNTYPFQGGLVASPVQGGFLNDLQAGMNENFDNKFDVSNLRPQNHGIGFKIGEALGTIGRGLGGTLGDAYIAGAEGLGAGLARQNVRTSDKLYRNQLKQMGYTDEDLSQIDGFLTSDMYKNLVGNLYKFRNLDQNTYMKMKTAYDRQLQQGIMTPEEYKTNIEDLNNQYVNSQIQTMQAGNVGISNQTRNTNVNEQLLPYKQYALQVSPQVAMGNLGVAQGNLALRQQLAPYDIAYKQAQLENMQNKASGDKTAMKAINENAATLADIDAGVQAINENPQAYSWLKGKLGADVANRIDPKGVATRTQIDNITAVYRKWLTGAQMSDQERKAYERFLPAPTDNAQIVKAKLNGMKQSIERKNQILMQGINTQPIPAQNADPLGIL